MFLRLIFSFTYIISFLVPYAWVSVESIACIILSSFEPKAIVLTTLFMPFPFKYLN